MLLFIIIAKKFIAVSHADRLLVLSIELVVPKRFVDHCLSKRIQLPISDCFIFIIGIMSNMLELMCQYLVRRDGVAMIVHIVEVFLRSELLDLIAELISLVFLPDAAGYLLHALLL